MGETGLSVEGLEELSEQMRDAIRVYPDLAEEKLREVANDFRRSVIEREKKVIWDDTAVVSKKKITTKRGFSLSRTKGYRENMEIDFRAEAPHFHLVENGHEQVTKKGRKVGWVRGNHVVKLERKTYEKNKVMSTAMKDVLKELTKRSSLE